MNNEDQSLISDSEPLVKILWSEDDYFFHEGEEYPLSKADSLFRFFDLQQTINKNGYNYNGEPYYTTKYQINFIQNNHNDFIIAEQEIGSNSKSLINNLKQDIKSRLTPQWQKFAEINGIEENKEELIHAYYKIIPYLDLHIALSETEKYTKRHLDDLNSIKKDGLDYKTTEYMTAVKSFVSQCREILNTENEIVFPMFPIPELYNIPAHESSEISYNFKDLYTLPLPIMKMSEIENKYTNEIQM